MRDRLHYYAQGRLTNNCSCCIQCYILHHTFTTEADDLLREDYAMTKTEFATKSVRLATELQYEKCPSKP